MSCSLERHFGEVALLSDYFFLFVCLIVDMPRINQSPEKAVILKSHFHLTENYYTIDSETIVDVNNYIPFSIFSSQTIDVM